jgi:alkaline phosphatase
VQYISALPGRHEPDIPAWSATVQEAPGASQDDTGTEVRLAAAGPQAANVLGITDQTDLFHTMARALGVEP